MGLIHVMPESLANQIAAGEVVERPASCVKELVENSLDAGAKHVLVTLSEGGIASIVVQDDGRGMDEEDVVLAFERHATSKVRHPRDLFALRTLGFRGEALASIAAVARVTLASRRPESTEGVQYRVEGTDKREGPASIGMPPGTRVEVHDLFFNTPARLKYLKSVTTEQARCVEVVQRIAIGRPDVAFTCQVGDTVAFRTDGRGDVRTVLAALYGVGEARQFLAVSAESSDYEIRGWVGRPTQSRSNRAHGYLYINDRSIRNLAIHQAVVSAFGPRLMVNRHPMYVIRIDMDPKLVDVNIHPHKAEVRFSEERDITRLVESAVKSALDEAFLVTDAPIPARTGDAKSVLRNPVGGPSVAMTGQSSLRTQRPLFHVDPPSRVTRPIEQEAIRAVLDTPKVQVDERRGEIEAAASVVASQARDAGESYEVQAALDQTGVAEDTQSSDVARKAPSEWRLRPVGQALGMYMLADDGESLYIIDQHAAHEKILYERFLAAMRSSEVGRIPLLTPMVLHLSAAERMDLDTHLPLLASLGLELEPFGGSDLVVRTVPSIWEGLDLTSLAQSFVTELATGGGRDARDALLERLVMRACKAAIKANHRLSEPEMEALCNALTALDDPFHCPHGRPIFIRMTGRDLEKGFKRIV